MHLQLPVLSISLQCLGPQYVFKQEKMLLHLQENLWEACRAAAPAAASAPQACWAPAFPGFWGDLW